MIFDFLPAEGFSCVNSQAYTAMIASGLDVAAFLDEGPWFDLGDPGLYLAANRALLSGNLLLPQVGTLQGVAADGVLLGERVTLQPEVSLGPEVAVGDDCVLGRGCQVARSVIWPESTVEPEARLDGMVVAGEMVVET
jgi:mannose-1-phosphate guanylyltransferase